MGHKSSLSEFKKIEIILSIFSDHNTETGDQLQKQKQKQKQKTKNTCRLNSTFLNGQVTKSMGCSKSSSKRKVHSNIILPQETRKTLTRQPKFTLKTTGKRTKKLKVSRRKEIIKFRAEIIEKEMKEKIVKINKSESWFFDKIYEIKKTLSQTHQEKKREESNQHN